MRTNERRELADFIKDNHIVNLCQISGDAHMIAIDDGSNSDYATDGGACIPVFWAGPLDRTPSPKGGPYTHGMFPGTEGIVEKAQKSVVARSDVFGATSQPRFQHTI